MGARPMCNHFQGCERKNIVCTAQTTLGNRQSYCGDCCCMLRRNQCLKARCSEERAVSSTFFDRQLLSNYDLSLPIDRSHCSAFWIAHPALLQNGRTPLTNKIWKVTMTSNKMGGLMQLSPWPQFSAQCNSHQWSEFTLWNSDSTWSCTSTPCRPELARFAGKQQDPVIMHVNRGRVKSS